MSEGRTGCNPDEEYSLRPVAQHCVDGILFASFRAHHVTVPSVGTVSISYRFASCKGASIPVVYDTVLPNRTLLGAHDGETEDARCADNPM